MEINEREKDLFLTREHQIAVIGVGGIGSWTALFSSMAGIPRIHLFDKDKVDITNLNRTPYKMSDIGKPKVLAMKEIINSYRPDCMVIPHQYNFDDQCQLIDGMNYVIDCTDNLESQKIIEKRIKAKQIKYIKAGYDNDQNKTLITVQNSNEKIWDNQPTQRGYSTPPTPSFIAPSVIGAGLVVFSLLKNIRPAMTIRLEKIINQDIF